MARFDDYVPHELDEVEWYTRRLQQAKERSAYGAARETVINDTNAKQQVLEDEERAARGAREDLGKEREKQHEQQSNLLNRLEDSDSRQEVLHRKRGEVRDLCDVLLIQMSKTADGGRLNEEATRRLLEQRRDLTQDLLRIIVETCQKALNPHPHLRPSPLLLEDQGYRVQCIPPAQYH
ncbi:hypothetical protein LTS14_010293 [Recurvomyces mirabilis]|nr:hypothetical protein LTS14_010293 [Recurvomyces mirabilis]